MNRQWLIVAVLSFLILVLVGMGWIVRDRFAPVEVGTTAPDFTATDLTGNPVALSDLAGKVVLVNIWATWCPPCVEEMPAMQRLYEAVADPGFEIVAVSIDAPLGLVGASGQQGGDVSKFVSNYELTFPVWLDPQGRIQRIYRATAVPESFVISRDGQIITKVLGARDWDSEANVELIRRLLQA